MTEKNTETINALTQKLVLDSRKHLEVNGVKDVEEFSDKQVILITNLGKLSVKGENLKISKLNVDTGDFCVNGIISSLAYSKAQSVSAGGFFERLFK